MSALALVPTPKQELSSELRIGASQAASAIGLGYQSPLDVWLEKTGRKPSFAGNEKTRWGQVLEPVIRAHYLETHDVTVYVPPTSLKHSGFSFITATPDGIVIDDDNRWKYVAPQVKNVGLRMSEAWEVVPECYLIQAVVEMAVTNLPRLDFAVLVGGQEYVEHTVHRDGDIEETLLYALQEFWSLVTNGIEPGVDGSASFKSHLIAKIKRAGVLSATPADREVMRQFRDVVKKQKALEAEEDTLKNLLLSSMAQRGGNAIKDIELGTVSLGAGRRNTQWKAVAESLGASEELIALNTSQTESSLVRPRNWSK